MTAVARHVALAVAIWALAAAGWRVAGRLGASGLERALGAATFAAAAAVAWSLALGLLGAGTNVFALLAAVAATWLLARHAVASSPASIGRASRRARIAAGAAAGLAGTWTAWLLLHPALGHDMLLYHLPEAIDWVRDGHPGSVHDVVVGLPVGAYPLTYEVLLSFALGVAHSFVGATLAMAAAPVLVAAALVSVLRALAAPPLARALAAAALVATPAVIAAQSGGAALDPAALGWLLTTAALCLAARRSPALIGLALVAAGLAIGTKTTTAPLAVAILVATGVWLRHSLRAAPVALGLVAATVVGGVWYLRDLFVHGSPLWPFYATPWGDRLPRLIAAADISFLDHPGRTVSRLGGYYLDHFAGPLLLLAAGLLSPLALRTRAVAVAALATAASILIWANSPFTGVFGQRAFDVGTGDATRYLLPGVAVATTAVALVARRPGWRRAAACAVLAAAAALGLVDSFRLGFPNVPAPSTPLLGAVVGAAIAAIALPRLAPRWLWPAAAVALGIAGAVAAGGYVGRYARSPTPQSQVAGWIDRQPAWRDGGEAVDTTFSLIAPLAGDRLQHRLELIGPREPCAAVAARRRRAWIVLDRPAARSDAAGRCLRAAPPAYADEHYLAYGPQG